MNLRAHHHLGLFILTVAIASGAAWLVTNHREAIAACYAGFSTNIVSPVAGATASGNVLLKSTVSSATQPSGVTFYVSAPTSAVIGSATATTSGSNVYWTTTWGTTAIANGAYQIIAVAHYGNNTTNDCPSQPRPIVVNNPAPTPQPTLSVSVTPSSLVAQPGQRIPYHASGIYTTASGAQTPISSITTATYVWEASGGSLSTTSGPAAMLTAGPQTGNFGVKVTVNVNGLSKYAYASYQIAAPTTSNSSSSTSSGGTTAATSTATPTVSPQEVTYLTSTASIFRPSSPTNSAPAVPIDVMACMHQKLGENYAAISSGQTQPSIEQRLKAVGCFSGTNRIPASLAPVNPAQIKEVPQDKTIIKINKIANTTITKSDGKKVPAIVLTGTAGANSDVLLYFFSDPLVLKAESDSQGKWTYTLEDPLKPGDHEVYAVSAKDSSTFVRTSAIPLAVAAAAGGGDGSLIIPSRFQPTQIAFAAAAVLLTLIVIFFVFRLRRRSIRRSANQIKPGIPPSSPPAAQTTRPSAPMPPDQPTPPPPPNDPQS